VTDPPGGLTAARRRREIGLGMLRALATTAALVALYYLLPLDRLANVPLVFILGAGLLILVAVATWQLRAVLRARYPGVRAAVSLAATVPFFLLLFASAYYVMAHGTPGSFSQQLTRTDALYFTVTTFTTVGFGDITATSQTARLVVTVQMLLDLLALGLGIRVFIGAVKRARQAQSE
jgi:voltage-gated potassium channel